MNMTELLRQFKFCPICTEKLQVNPYYRHRGVLYCSEHGDFFVHRGMRGMPLAVVIKTYPEVIDYEVRTPRRGRRIKCQSNGIHYESVGAAARDLGLDAANIFHHLNNPTKYKRVGGFTFVYLDYDITPVNYSETN